MRQRDQETVTPSKVTQARKGGDASTSQLFTPRESQILPQSEWSKGVMATQEGIVIGSKATGSAPVQASHPLLKLQRQQGNRYIQRAVDLMRKENDKDEVSPEVVAAINRKRGGGQALDSRVRAQMETAFGADFKGVRVHMDTEADSLNQAMNAHAFTSGQDIFFRPAMYSPATPPGRALLVHELTHVVQQNLSNTNQPIISPPGSPAELEAERCERDISSKHVMCNPVASRHSISRQRGLTQEERSDLETRVGPLVEYKRGRRLASLPASYQKELIGFLRSCLNAVKSAQDIGVISWVDKYRHAPSCTGLVKALLAAPLTILGAVYGPTLGIPMALATVIISVISEVPDQDDPMDAFKNKMLKSFDSLYQNRWNSADAIIHNYILKVPFKLVIEHSSIEEVKLDFLQSCFKPEFLNGLSIEGGAVRDDVYSTLDRLWWEPKIKSAESQYRIIKEHLRRRPLGAI